MITLFSLNLFIYCHFMLIFLVHLKDDEETESTETSILKSHLVNGEPVLASPDLLSEVCDMKQDLIKMTAILTTDSPQKAGSLKAKTDIAKTEEVPGEPFEIVEKVKEDLEKVNEILRTGSYTREEVLHEKAHSSRAYNKEEEWVIVGDDEVEEAKLSALLDTDETPCIEIRIDRGEEPKIKSDINEMVSYLTNDLKSYSSDSSEGGTPKKDQRKFPLEIKKPVRRKLRERQREEELQCMNEQSGLTKFSSEESLDDDLGLITTPVPSVKEVSPVIEETPIGSIKDKVKALQKRVEEEQKGLANLSSKTQTKDVVSETTKQQSAVQVIKPPVSPSLKTERLEETMSVRDLMKAFQSGHDPSKERSGLFEHKTIKTSVQKQMSTESKSTESSLNDSKVPTNDYIQQDLGQLVNKRGLSSNESEQINEKDNIQLKSVSDNVREKEEPSILPHIVSKELVSEIHTLDETPKKRSDIRLKVSISDQEVDLQISPDRKTSTDFSDVIKEELEDNDKYLQFKHLPEAEGAQLNLDQVLISPFNVSFPSEYGTDGFLPSLHLQSGTNDDSSDSLKHEGIADSPSGSLLDGTPHMSSEDSCKHEGLAETPGTSPESLSFSPKKPDEQVHELILEGKGDESVLQTVSCKSDKFTEEIIGETSSGVQIADHSFEIKESSLENKQSPKQDELHVTIKSPQGLELILSTKHMQDDEVSSPLADESLAISHKDSLESSPVLEDNSSHKTPDSLEPSPTKESPCRDSLENSPVENKIKSSILIGSALHSSLKSDLTTELIHRSRILRDPDGSAEDDSVEQTSLMESSGKSPLSPDTPSSEEISYDVTPKIHDNHSLSGHPKPGIIPEVSEEAEEDSENEPKKRFTPEEEMFKMVTKIKMFDELEQEAKQKREYKKEFKPDECTTIDDSNMSNGDDLEHDIKLVQDEDVHIVVMSVESRKSSSSSESEPELTQLKKGAYSGLLLDPVIRVQPPSPLPPGLDSSSSPEETAFQPIKRKQDSFKTKEIGSADTNNQSKKQGEHSRHGSTNSSEDESMNIQTETRDVIIDPSHLKITEVTGVISPIEPVAQENNYIINSVNDLEEESKCVIDVQSNDSSITREMTQGHYTTQCLEHISHDTVKSEKANVNVTDTNIAFSTSILTSSSTNSQNEMMDLECSAYVPEITSPYENVPIETYFTSHDIGEHHATEHSKTEKVLSVASESSLHEDDFQKDKETLRCSSTSDECCVTDALNKTDNQCENIIITKSDAEPDSWSSIREDDAAFEARVKEEEQKIFGLMVDKQSQGTTPDTTPARTPTEDGTPTSEQNPFMFQEGKLFEMTRSGAIDMTKRNYAEESFHFFQIGQQCGESLPEEIKEESGEEESPVPESLSDPFSAAEMQDSADSMFDTLSIADTDVDSVIDMDTEGAKTEQKSRIPIKMGISASSKISKKDNSEMATEETQSLEISKSQECFESSLGSQLSYPEQSVVDMQIDLTTLSKVDTLERVVSPDSSPEEQKSVIEIPTAVMDCGSSFVSKSKIPIRSSSSSASEELSQSIIVNAQEKLSTDGLISTDDQKPKSKIPIKATIPKSEQFLTSLEQKTSEFSSKIPVKQDIRSKSESDAHKSDSKTKTSTKTQSCTESYCEISGGLSQIVEGENNEATKPKLYASRIPTTTKSLSYSQTTSATEQERFFEMYKNSIDFFEEISDEASKLVDRLTQAEKEQEPLSDDESSAFEISVIENVPVIESQQSAPEDIFDTRPIWDDSIETQIERILDDHSHDNTKGLEEDQERVEQRLAYIADHLGFSWTELARELDFTEEQIHQIRIENPNSLQDQSHALLKYWLDRDGKKATDTSLNQCLTKINRMDIVHLMETCIKESVLQQHNRTYADIEQTITLDHSEGFSALQDEFCSPQKKTGVAPLDSRYSERGEHPPLVAEEDVSISYSSFHESSKDDKSVSEIIRQLQKEKVVEFSEESQELSRALSSENEYLVTSPDLETKLPEAAEDTLGFKEVPQCPQGTYEEFGRPTMETPVSDQTSSSPIVQEPDDLSEQEDQGASKNDLFIVESSDEHADKLENVSEYKSFDSFEKDLAEELGELDPNSDEDEMVTTRVVRRRVIIQADNMPDILPETVTEEQYTDEHGHIVVKKVTRKIIRRFVLPDGTEKEEVVAQGGSQDAMTIEEGDSVSKVVKRTVLKSDSEQSENKAE